MTIFSIVSAVFVAICTGYSIILVYKHKNKLTNTPGVMLSMVIAVITGLLSGSITGIMSGETFLTVGISMIIGFIIGFLAGHPVGILAILMASIAGLMGGINGALLGLFLQFINPTILLGILLGFYIVIIGFVIVYIKVAVDSKYSIDTQELSPFAILGAGVVLVALFLFLYSSDLVKIPGKTETAGTQTETAQETGSQTSAPIEVDVTKQSKPKVNMTITDKGYSVNVIRVKKGVPVELDIENPGVNSCITTFMMPDFDLNHINLKVGTTKLSFTPEKEGEYTFSCGMNMFKGKVIVE